MINSKNAFLGIFGLLFAAGAANAQVADVPPVLPVQNEPMPAFVANTKDEAVLFKVHDITPVKGRDKDGAVESCDFYVTFYNRSNKDINGAVLDLTWLDDSLIDIIDAEKAESAEKITRGEGVDPNYSYTQNDNPTNLTATIDMPAIKSYKQITVRSRIKTDRCFVLLEDLSMNVKSCSTKNEPGAGTVSVGMGANAGCNGLFRFVSSKNPEYYMEFKSISYDEQKAEERKQRVNEEQSMEENYRKAIEGFDRLSNVLAEIK